MESVLVDGGSNLLLLYPLFTMIWSMCLSCFHMIALNYQQAVILKHDQEMQQMNEFMLEIIGTDESKEGGREGDYGIYQVLNEKLYSSEICNLYMLVKIVN